jgi:hypothetical protein
VADVEILYDPISINSGPVTVTVDGLNDIKIDSSLAVTKPIETDSKLTLSVPDTIKTDTKFAFTIPEPIRTDSKAAIDLQPVVLDQCLRLSLGPLPATRICLPNRQRIGLTVFGVEVIGLTLDGEAQVVVGEPHRQTHIVGGEAHAAGHGPHAGHDHETGSGLRIRLGG